MSDKQSDFFSFVQSPSPALSDFAEICNALYERELLNLAYSGPKQLSLMQRKLAGLTNHVKRIAYFLCKQQDEGQWPLDVDSHNASWQSKQAAKSPGRNNDAEKTLAWYQQNAAPGLIVPIRVRDLDNETIELDCIDRVHQDEKRVHVNKFGWFDYAGMVQETRFTEQEIILLKPTKAIMQAACCGHSWNHKSKNLPRSLTLREMMLSTQIDWKHFRLKPVARSL